MYFVEAIKPELSVDGLGLVPNDLFQERLSTLLSERFNFRKSEQRILKLLTDNLPEGLYYHGIHHTLDVTQAAERIARHEGIDGEELFLLKTAALFHDAGFIHEYNKNEHLGVTMAKEILPNYGYSEERKAEILRAYHERSSLRGLERTFGVARQTVSAWLIPQRAQEKSQ